MNEYTFIVNSLQNDLTASDQLIQAMLNNIGSLSPELRDSIIYSGWCQLFEEEKLNEEQKNWLVTEISARNLLFQGIEKGQTDDVFTRSFTSLLLVQLLDDQRKHGWLTSEREQRLIDHSLDYMETESDNRGLVEEAGWAHAFAHGADLLTAVAESPFLTVSGSQRILAALTRGLLEIDDFLWSEESRMVPAILVLLRRNYLNQDELNTWIQKNNEVLLLENSWNICWNRFLTSLSWTLKFEALDFEKVQETIFLFLKDSYTKRRII